MPGNIRLASYRPSGQGEAGYETAAFGLNCPGYPHQSHVLAGIFNAPFFFEFLNAQP